MEDVAGKTPRILQGPEKSQAARNEIRFALKKWRPVRVEIQNYRKDGTDFWIELNIVPVANENRWFTHWGSMQRDVTERKREEEERRRSEELFRNALTKQASDIVTIVDADGMVRYVSPSMKNVLGMRPEEMIGNNLSGFVHPDDVERVLGAVAERASKPGVGKPIELRTRHQDSSWRHLEAIGTHMLDDPSVRGGGG